MKVGRTNKETQLTSIKFTKEDLKRLAICLNTYSNEYICSDTITEMRLVFDRLSR